MPWFRKPDQNPALAASQTGWGNSETLRFLIQDCLLPKHFYVAATADLDLQYIPVAEIPWEVFHGQLLDPSHTTLRRNFAIWNLFWIEHGKRSKAPIISILLDQEIKLIYVTRSIQRYVWEGYHAGNNVYLSREISKWVQELAGVITLAEFRSERELRDEILCRLFHVVIGGSRLPLTSPEAPLPAFTLGQIAYCNLEDDRSSTANPIRSWRDLLKGTFNKKLARLEKIKLLEFMIRAVPSDEVGLMADFFVEHESELGATQMLALFRSLFNEIALSPYTDFVTKALAFCRHLVWRDYLRLEGYIDLLSYLLRQIGRHLTAYDLVMFHHRGANYPDMLLLDEVIKAYLQFIESNPALFLTKSGDNREEKACKRIRRRALRQGWLLRRRYEGLPVTICPTSPGENLRVMPAQYVRVPDDEIMNPAKRTKFLFANDSLDDLLGSRGKEILALSIQDLTSPLELRELGLGVFLDRPLGTHKKRGEADCTLLLSYEAFSRSIAEQRLQFLENHLASLANIPRFRDLLGSLKDLKIGGLKIRPATGLFSQPIVSLQDALKVADDFVVLQSTSSSIRNFMTVYNFEPLRHQTSMNFLSSDQITLVAGSAVGQGGSGLLSVFDGQLTRRMELQINEDEGYRSRGGIEYPAAGFIVRRMWELTPNGIQERGTEMRILIRENT